MSTDSHNESVTRVKDIMTFPVHQVDMDDSLLRVKRLFDHANCHHVVVLQDKRVVGVVSDRDILRSVSPFAGNEMMERRQDLNTLKKRVHQIMSRDIVTAEPDDTVAQAAEKILEKRVSCLPVVDDNNAPLGIITSRDLIEWAAGSLLSKPTGTTESAQDGRVLIIMDGRRCYAADPSLERLIRKAERTLQREQGTETATAPCLSLGGLSDEQLAREPAVNPVAC